MVAKKAVKKAVKKAIKKTAAKKTYSSVLPKNPTGYSYSSGGILQPTKGVVPAGKLAEGYSRARVEIQKFLQEIVDTATQDFAISEIELSASFNADGKFLGFGVGGEAIITIRIRPIEC